MRRLAETEVLKSAGIAAVVSCFACYPRLALWSKPTYPMWYLGAVLLAGTFVLWAFVFAWHTKYTGQPVFNFRPGAGPGLAATGAGILMAIVMNYLFDPVLRVRSPEEYPVNLQQWISMTLFSLALTQLFLVFAPFAWCLRLTKSRWMAIAFTAAFGVFVVVIKIQSSLKPIAPLAFMTLLVVRAITGVVFVWFYSRYGLVLASWWGFLVQARHLVDLVRD